MDRSQSFQPAVHADTWFDSITGFPRFHADRQVRSLGRAERPGIVGTATGDVGLSRSDACELRVEVRVPWATSKTVARLVVLCRIVARPKRVCRAFRDRKDRGTACEFVLTGSALDATREKSRLAEIRFG